MQGSKVLLQFLLNEEKLFVFLITTNSELTWKVFVPIKAREYTVVPGFRVLGFRALPGFGQEVQRPVTELLL